MDHTSKEWNLLAFFTGPTWSFALSNEPCMSLAALKMPLQVRIPQRMDQMAKCSGLGTDKISQSKLHIRLLWISTITDRLSKLSQARPSHRLKEDLFLICHYIMDFYSCGVMKPLILGCLPLIARNKFPGILWPWASLSFLCICLHATQGTCTVL